ncbi:MAG: glycosyltransferase [Bacteroidetes bacterium]|nr:glycosyltransferase [Bacteroidota bacterium]
MFPNTVFWVAGDLNDANPAGISKEKLLDWINNKDIQYLGRVLDVRKIIRNADVVVLPSYREGIPRVMLEALAMGKPTISTDAAGCKETIVHGKNGFIVPVKNQDALALAMTTLIESVPFVLEEMGRESRKMALEFFDEEIVTMSYVRLLNEIFSPKKFSIESGLYSEINI